MRYFARLAVAWCVRRARIEYWRAELIRFRIVRTLHEAFIGALVWSSDLVFHDLLGRPYPMWWSMCVALIAGVDPSELQT